MFFKRSNATQTAGGTPFRKSAREVRNGRGGRISLLCQSDILGTNLCKESRADYSSVYRLYCTECAPRMEALTFGYRRCYSPMFGHIPSFFCVVPFVVE